MAGFSVLAFLPNFAIIETVILETVAGEVNVVKITTSLPNLLNHATEELFLVLG